MDQHVYLRFKNNLKIKTTLERAERLDAMKYIDGGDGKKRSHGEISSTINNIYLFYYANILDKDGTVSQDNVTKSYTTLMNDINVNFPTENENDDSKQDHKLYIVTHYDMIPEDITLRDITQKKTVINHSIKSISDSVTAQLITDRHKDFCTPTLNNHIYNSSSSYSSSLDKILQLNITEYQLEPINGIELSILTICQSSSTSDHLLNDSNQIITDNVVYFDLKEIGCKRFISQAFHVISNNGNSNYIGIDYNTELLKGKDDGNNISNPKIDKCFTFNNVNNNKTCPSRSGKNTLVHPYIDAIKYFNDNKEDIIRVVTSPDNISDDNLTKYVYGFSKSTESSTGPCTQPCFSRSPSLYKFIIISYDVISQTWYDPMLLSNKEDTYWLNCVNNKKILMIKNSNISTCKIRKGGDTKQVERISFDTNTMNNYKPYFKLFERLLPTTISFSPLMILKGEKIYTICLPILSHTAPEMFQEYLQNNDLWFGQYDFFNSILTNSDMENIYNTIPEKIRKTHYKKTDKYTRWFNYEYVPESTYGKILIKFWNGQFESKPSNNHCKFQVYYKETYRSYIAFSLFYFGIITSTFDPNKDPNNSNKDPNNSNKYTHKHESFNDISYDTLRNIFEPVDTYVIIRDYNVILNNLESLPNSRRKRVMANLP